MIRNAMGMGGNFLGSHRAINITISTNQNKYNLFTAAGSPAGVVIANLTINSGVTVYSDTTATAALTVSGFAAGSTINVINNGTIAGMGGAGGSLTTSGVGNPGLNGGHAIATTIALNITNNGTIAGGGGGGGSGASYYSGYGDGGGGGQSFSASSGGTGGASGGNGANGSSTSGGNGSNAGGATGGSGAANGVAGGNGGNSNYGGGGGGGGGYGAAGGTGGKATIPNQLGGAGGAAGKAVNTGGNTITWLATGTRYGTYA